MNDDSEVLLRTLKTVLPKQARIVGSDELRHIIEACSSGRQPQYSSTPGLAEFTVVEALPLLLSAAQAAVALLNIYKTLCKDLGVVPTPQQLVEKFNIFRSPRTEPDSLAAPLAQAICDHSNA